MGGEQRRVGVGGTETRTCRRRLRLPPRIGSGRSIQTQDPLKIVSNQSREISYQTLCIRETFSFRVGGAFTYVPDFMSEKVQSQGGFITYAESAAITFLQQMLLDAKPALSAAAIQTAAAIKETFWLQETGTW